MLASALLEDEDGAMEDANAAHKHWQRAYRSYHEVIEWSTLFHLRKSLTIRFPVVTSTLFLA